MSRTRYTGWVRPFGKRYLTAHYFDGDGQALCGAWTWVGGGRRTFLTWKPHSRFCGACREAFNRRK